MLEVITKLMESSLKNGYLTGHHSKINGTSVTKELNPFMILQERSSDFVLALQWGQISFSTMHNIIFHSCSIHWMYLDPIAACLVPIGLFVKSQTPTFPGCINLPKN